MSESTMAKTTLPSLVHEAGTIQSGAFASHVGQVYSGDLMVQSTTRKRCCCGSCRSCCHGRRQRRSEQGKRKRRQMSLEQAVNESLVGRALKKSRRVANKLQTLNVLGYSNDSNPFGDSNLNKKFVWLKKIEKDVMQGVPLDEFTVKAERKRQREQMEEIEQAKKRREERALQKSKRDEEILMLQRERVRAEADDFEKKEGSFYLDQIRLKCRIRLLQGRAKPIDVFIRCLEHQSMLDVISHMDFKSLTIKEMEELIDDIKLHIELDSATPTHVEYWEALMVICEWELTEARRREAIDQANVQRELPQGLAVELGVHSSIETDVRELLEGKTCQDLVTIQSQIESNMRSGEAKVVEFWEAVLRCIHLYKAKACLKEINPKMLRHLQYLPEQRLQVENLSSEEEIENPEPSANHEVPEVNLDSQLYCWHDGSRKPKYFSRVHTSYDRNKYNQTHYDHDNPPPKMVQGYKFNIFYSDLIDKVKAPTYIIEKDGKSTETCIIRFHAGPPYEDIAFRIVNRDWEYSRKKGYKCTFEGGQLRVYFNIKRYRYRR